MAEQKKSKRLIAEEWLAFSLEGWKEEIKRLKIGDTNTLLLSFNGKVVANADNKLQVELAYAWYGQMVDMGVGRGTSNGAQKDNASTRRLLGSGAGADRRPKPWYTKGKKKNIGYQTHRLSELMADFYADETIQRITGSVSLNHIIKLD